MRNNPDQEAAIIAAAVASWPHLEGAIYNALKTDEPPAVSDFDDPEAVSDFDDPEEVTDPDDSEAHQPPDPDSPASPVVPQS